MASHPPPFLIAPPNGAAGGASEADCSIGAAGGPSEAHFSNGVAGGASVDAGDNMAEVNLVWNPHRTKSSPADIVLTQVKNPSIVFRKKTAPSEFASGQVSYVAHRVPP